MTDILKSDIFFFISSIGVVVVVILVVVALVYVISILRDMKKASQTVREGAEIVSDNIHTANKGFKKFIHFFSSLLEQLLGNQKKYGKKTKK